MRARALLGGAVAVLAACGGSDPEQTRQKIDSAAATTALASSALEAHQVARHYVRATLRVLRDAGVRARGGAVDAARFPRVADVLATYFHRMREVDDFAELHFRRGLALILAGMSQPLAAPPAATR